MQGTEIVIKALKDLGVRYVFGYTGGAIMPVFDEMEKQKAFDFIMSRHEQGAAFMAQGVSRADFHTHAPGGRMHGHIRSWGHESCNRRSRTPVWIPCR
jgi:acetolactate synthase-1/2/3 large subunit